MSARGFVLAALLGMSQAAPAENRGFWVDDPVSQTVFYAMLEGLYADGLSNDVVDLIIPPDPETGAPVMTEHFIYACPLCHPAFEAFRLYRSRRPFQGLKAGTVDTFGRGLDEPLVARLSSEQKSERLDAIQELIQKWVKRRLDAQRLTPAELLDWQRGLEARRAEGAKMLENFLKGGHGDYYRTLYADWKRCAICEGSAGACQLPR